MVKKSHETTDAQPEASLEGNALFQSLVDNVPGLIYQFYLRPNGEMGFQYMSEGARDLYEEEIPVMVSNPTVVFSKVHPDDAPGLQSAIQASAATLTRFKWEGRFLFAGGRIKWIQAASTPRALPDGKILWEGLMMDVSEKRVAQELVELQKMQLISSAKLAALGEMAGCIAHEINNPLAIIHGKVDQIRDLIAQETISPEDIRENIDRIELTVDRIWKIIRSLKVISKESDVDERFEEVAVNTIVEECLELCKGRFVSHGVEFNLSLAPPVQPSNVNPPAWGKWF